MSIEGKPFNFISNDQLQKQFDNSTDNKTESRPENIAEKNGYPEWYQKYLTPEINRTANKKREFSEQEKIETAKKLADLLMDKYVDQNNNLKKYKEIFEGGHYEGILDENVENLWEKINTDDIHDELNSIGELYTAPELDDELINRFSDKNNSLKNRIILAQILYDITYNLLEDDAGHGYLTALKKSLADQDNPVFFQFYLNILTKRCDELIEEFYGESFGKSGHGAYYNDFYNFHEKKFDAYRLELTPEMSNLINQEHCDEFSYDKFYPMQKDYELGYSRPGDYIVAKLSPDNYGIYTRQGTVIGYAQLDQRTEKPDENNKLNPLEKIKREYSFCRSFELDGNDDIKKNPALLKTGWPYMKTIETLLTSEQIKDYEQKKNIKVKFNIFLQHEDFFLLNLNVYDTYNGRKNHDQDVKVSELKKIIYEEIAKINFVETLPEEITRLTEKLSFPPAEKAKHSASSIDYYNEDEDERPPLKVENVENLLKNLANNKNDEEIFLFKLMSSLPFRQEIKKKLGFDPAEFDLKNQYYFLQFIGQKTRHDFEKVEKFIADGKTEDAKINRVKSFLSLEFGQDMGDKILSIGESLKNPLNAGTADLLFSQYAQLAGKTERMADEICQMYNEIFFDRTINKVNKDEIAQTILKRASTLLSVADEKLKNTEDSDKEAMTRELIDDLIRNELAHKKSLEEFKEMAVNLDSLYFEIEPLIIKYGITEDDIKLSANYSKLADEWNSQTDKWNSSVNEHSEATRQTINKLTEEKVRIKKEGLEQRNLNNDQYKSVVQRLEKLLQYGENLEHKLVQIIYGHESASLPKNFQEEIANDIKDYQAELPKSEKTGYLPVGVSSQLPKENEIHAKPIDALTGLFWLNNQGPRQEFMVVDTIQETNYRAIFNLQQNEAKAKAEENGRRDKEWYGAVINVFNLDNIVVKDYGELEQDPRMKVAAKNIDRIEQDSPIIKQALSGLVEEKIRQRALAGLEERKGQAVTTRDKDETEKLITQYGKTEIAAILAKGGLKISHEKKYRYDILARTIPIYQKLQQKQGQIYELARLRGAELDKALAELSLYLGYYHHFPESYHLAVDLFETKETANKLNSQIRTAKDYELKNKLNLEKKQNAIKAESLEKELQKATNLLKESSEQEQIKEITKTAKDLGLTMKKPEDVIAKWRAKGKDIVRQNWWQTLSLPEFYYAKTITGATFDMKDDKGREHYSNKREFYSTIKGTSEDEAALESKQVMASTNILAGAKLLVLSEKIQKKYYEERLRPLLVNYYLAASPNKERAVKKFREDIGETKTIAEIIELIQKKIVWPIEMELRQQSGVSPDNLKN